MSSQPASSVSYIPPPSGTEQSSPLIPSQYEKESEEHGGLVIADLKSVDVPDPGNKIMKSQEALVATGDQDLYQDLSTTNGQPQVSLGSDQDVKETKEQGVQVGGEQQHQMLEPAEQLEQSNALLPEKQRARGDYEVEEPGLGFVNHETGKQGHFPVDQTRCLMVQEEAECFMEEDNWQVQ